MPSTGAINRVLRTASRKPPLGSSPFRIILRFLLRTNSLICGTETVPKRNGILVARKDELAGVDLPEHINSKLSRLRTDEGLIAEIIPGSAPNQHRWIILSGADDDGLEKADLAFLRAELFMQLH